MVIMVGYEKRFLNILSFIIQTQKVVSSAAAVAVTAAAAAEGRKKIYDAEECIIAILHTEADSH